MHLYSLISGRGVINRVRRRRREIGTEVVGIKMYGEARRRKPSTHSSLHRVRSTSPARPACLGAWVERSVGGEGGGRAHVDPLSGSLSNWTWSERERRVTE